MLKYMTLHFSGPICTCRKQDLRLGYHYGKEISLVVSCAGCGVKLSIPGDHLDIKSTFDVPYPDGLATDEANGNVSRLAMITDE